MMSNYSLGYPALRWLDAASAAPDAPWLNRFTAGSGEATLLNSCFAALARETLGNLKTLPQAVRENWAEYIAARQSPDDGFFYDPIFVAEDLVRSKHGLEYLTWQQTFFSAAALHALGARPPRPFRFLDSFLAAQEIEAWLAGLEWSDPWLVSNQIMFIVSFLIQDGERYGVDAYQNAVRRVFDWLDAHQNPETGFWDLGQGASLHNAMAGAFHFYFLYFYLGRVVRYPERIIDNTLATQHADGLFSPAGGGGACLDLDAIDILVKFSLLVDYRGDEIKSALRRAFEAILRNQNPDGGFCEAKRPAVWKKSRKRKLMELFGVDRLLRRPWQGRPVQYQMYSGWNKMHSRIDESDIWSAWFRPLALGLISARYPGEFIEDIAWQFHTSPALGWHDERRLLDIRKKYDDRTSSRGEGGPWEPLLSVIMAVHNGEPFLREAIDSILNQTYRNFEFIIVDDASTDATPQTLAGYADERIVCIKNEKNLGLAASLNVGIRAARGELIARQDADDVSFPDRFRRQVDFLAAHPAVGLLSTDYQVIDVQGRVLEPVLLPSGNQELQQRLEHGNVFVHSNILMRREVLEQAGGYRDYFVMTQDYDLFLRIAECSEIANLPVMLHSVRIHPSSGSRKKHELQIAYKQLAQDLAQKRRRGLPEGPLPEDLLGCYPPESARLFADARAISYLYYTAEYLEAAEEMVGRARAYQTGGEDPTTEWADWIIDRAHRLAQARAAADAGAAYLAWMMRVLRTTGLAPAARRLTARYYAEQAFAGHAAGAAQNTRACAARALLLNPAWATNRGLVKILLKSLLERNPVPATVDRRAASS